jgi:hypothetical protein
MTRTRIVRRRSSSLSPLSRAVVPDRSNATLPAAARGVASRCRDGRHTIGLCRIANALVASATTSQNPSRDPFRPQRRPKRATKRAKAPLASATTQNPSRDPFGAGGRRRRRRGVLRPWHRPSKKMSARRCRRGWCRPSGGAENHHNRNQRGMGKKSDRPESNQRPRDYCVLYSRMLYQLSYDRVITGRVSCRSAGSLRAKNVASRVRTCARDRT